MKRAQSMAQAAWRRPGLRLSSWSCIGPRQRATASHSDSTEENSLVSATKTETSEPLLVSANGTTTTTIIETSELSASSSRGVEWTSKIESSYSDEIVPVGDEGADISDSEDLMGHNRHEDRMTEVELWQQLEQELYDRTEGDDGDDVAKEIREEEAAAMAEARDSQPESSSPEMKEVHRFFPAGKIMHIVFIPPDDDADSETDSSPTSSGSNNGQPEEPRIGIFLTPRSLYSKLRLSQSMISDHIMPVYRRQIEKLIEQLEKEEAPSAEEVVL